MLQEEHSAILSTFIKFPFVIKIFCLFLSGRFTQVLLSLPCGGGGLNIGGGTDIPGGGISEERKTRKMVNLYHAGYLDVLHSSPIYTVNSEIFARILFLRKSLKGIFGTLKLAVRA